MFPEGDIADPNVQRGLPTGWHRRFLTIFRAQLEWMPAFSANERRGPEERNRGFGFASSSRSLVFPQEDTTGPTCRGLVFPDEDIAGPHSNTAFDPSLDYSTDKVVLFWQTPSYSSPWSPSSFVVDDVSYSCAEQYMMAEKASFFKAIEQWSSSCRRLTQARTNASVEARAILAPLLGTGQKQNAVLSGTYAKFTQNPAMKKSPFEL